MKKTTRKINNQSGSAMLISVVFFIFIFLAIISGLVGPTLREFKSANNSLNSKRSYFLAESGGEDAFFRIKNNMAISSSESLVLDSNSATTTITDNGFGNKSIGSIGDVNSLQRKTNIAFQVSAGSSFNYGVQVGEGGLILQNSSSVLGNVYSNGPVVGSGNISSNPTNPSFVGEVNVGSTAYRMVQNGTYIYVVNEQTIQTVNIANPAAPTVVATINTTLSGGQQKDIALSNGHLFVTASNGNDVVALTLTNPALPAYVSRVTVSGASQIKTLGSYAYVLTNAGPSAHSLKTINISNPSAMSVVNSVNTISTFPVGMAIQGTYLYVISQGGTSKLEIYNLANPASPALVSATTIGVNPITIAVAGSYAYIDVYACGCIQVYNISNPAAPVIVSSTPVNSLNNGHSLYVSGSYLYAAVYYSTKEFQVWDISNPNSLSKLNTINIAGGNPVHVIGGQSGYIYLLTQNNNTTSPLRIYRVSGSGGNAVSGDVVSAGPLVEVVNNSAVNNPINPPLIGTMPVGWGGNPPVDMVVSGNYAYLLCDSTFMVVDINDKLNPVIKKTVTTAITGNHSHSSIALSGNYLYITQLNDYVLSIYDITNPLEPVLLPSVNLGAQGGYPKTVTVSGGYAYVTRYTNSSPAIQIINVSNPASAVLVKTMTVPNWPRWITISGGHMYVTFDQGGTANMQIYSLTNLANPTLVYSMPSNIMLGGHAREYIAGNYMYVDAGDNGRLHVADITNKASPIVKFDSPYSVIQRPTRMDGAAGYLYISENTYTGNTATPRFQVWSIANPILPVQVNIISIPPIEWGIVDLLVNNDHLYILDSGYNTTGNLRIYRIGPDAPSFVSMGRIEKINATASMYASTIKDSIAGANAYFKSILNTTVFGASYPNSTDQPTTIMPISDAVIDQWETDAASAGVITTPCPYKINSDTTIGPVKINCDLEIRGNTTVSLAGNVWVNGNVTLNNNGLIQVSSGISGKTVAIIADSPTNRSSSSTVTISNSIDFIGSGANSYVMLVSRNTSAETGGIQVAINSSNNVTGKVLLYAPHGEVRLGSSATVKEVTAWKILLQNSAQVIYETGLANLLFTSGPAGGYIFDTWGEVQ